MKKLQRYNGEVPTWASPFLYHDLPFDCTERDAVKLDIFLYLPDTQIIVEGPGVLLVREGDGTLGLVDIECEHIFKLRSPTYSTALQLLEKPPKNIGVHRNYIKEVIGFWVTSNSRVVAMFDEDSMPEQALLSSTTLFATPTKLRRRSWKSQQWETILTCIPFKQLAPVSKL